MSKVVGETGMRELSHYVEADNGKQYYVDSRDIPYIGCETVVFIMKNGVAGWLVYCERYATYKEMKDKHNYIINHIEEFVEE